VTTKTTNTTAGSRRATTSRSAPPRSGPVFLHTANTRETPPPGTYIVVNGQVLTSKYHCKYAGNGLKEYTWTCPGGVFTDMNNVPIAGLTFEDVLYWPIQVGVFTITCYHLGVPVATATDVRQYSINLVQDDLGCAGWDVWLNAQRNEPNCEAKDTIGPPHRSPVEPQFDFPTALGDPGCLYASRREPCLYRLVIDGPNGSLVVRLDYTFNGLGRIDTGTPGQPTALRDMTFLLLKGPGMQCSIDGHTRQLDNINHPWLIDLPYLSGVANSGNRRDIEIDVRIPPTSSPLNPRFQGISEFEMCTVVSVRNIVLSDDQQIVPMEGLRAVPINVTFEVTPYDVLQHEFTKSLVYFRDIGSAHPTAGWHGKRRYLDRILKADNGFHTLNWPGDYELDEDRTKNCTVLVAGFAGAADIFWHEDVNDDGFEPATEDRIYPMDNMAPWNYPSGDGVNNVEPFEIPQPPVGGWPSPELIRPIVLFSPDIDVWPGSSAGDPYGETAEDAGDPFVPVFGPGFGGTAPKRVKARLQTLKTSVSPAYLPGGTEPALRAEVRMQSDGYTQAFDAAAGGAPVPDGVVMQDADLPKTVYLQGMSVSPEKNGSRSLEAKDTDTGGITLSDEVKMTVFTAFITSSPDLIDPKLEMPRSIPVIYEARPNGSLQYKVWVTVHNAAGGEVRSLASNQTVTGGGSQTQNWNGKNDAGVVLDPGDYFVAIEVQPVGDADLKHRSDREDEAIVRLGIAKVEVTTSGTRHRLLYHVGTAVAGAPAPDHTDDHDVPDVNWQIEDPTVTGIKGDLDDENGDPRAGPPIHAGVDTPEQLTAPATGPHARRYNQPVALTRSAPLQVKATLGVEAVSKVSQNEIAIPQFPGWATLCIGVAADSAPTTFGVTGAQQGETKVDGVQPGSVADFTSTASTPDAVTKSDYDLTWTFYLKTAAGSYITLGEQVTTARVYWILGAPGLPWSSGGATSFGFDNPGRAWVRAVDKAVEWAAGVQSVSAAAKAIADHLYDSDPYDYHIAGGASHGDALPTWYRGRVGAEAGFEFTNWVYNVWVAGGAHQGACYDQACTIALLSNSLGGALQVRYVTSTGAAGHWAMNVIDLIGSSTHASIFGGVSELTNTMFTAPGLGVRQDGDCDRNVVEDGSARAWFSNHLVAFDGTDAFDACWRLRPTSAQQPFADTTARYVATSATVVVGATNAFDVAPGGWDGAAPSAPPFDPALMSGTPPQYPPTDPLGGGVRLAFNTAIGSTATGTGNYPTFMALPVYHCFTVNNASDPGHGNVRIFTSAHGSGAPDLTTLVVGGQSRPVRVQIYDPTAAPTPASQAGVAWGAYGTNNIDSVPFDGTGSLSTTDYNVAAR
jgi:hypothetical protein